MEEKEKLAAEAVVASPKVEQESNQELAKQEVELGLDTGNRGDYRKKVNTILKGLVKANSDVVKDLQASHKDMQTAFTELSKLGRYVQQDYEDKQETALLLSFLLNCLGDEYVEYSNDKGPYPLSLYFNVTEPVEGITFIHLNIPSNKYRFIIKIDADSNLSLIKFSLLNDGIRSYTLANVSEEIDEKEPNPEVKKFKCTFTRESKLETTEDLNEVVFIELNPKTATKTKIFDTAFYELYKKLYVTSNE